MDKDGYEYIPGYKEKMLLRKETRPLFVPDEESNVWAEIENQVIEFSQENESQFPDHERVVFYENIFNLISGTINLINFVLLSCDSKKPIETIVFLDKSARLAAHIFRVLWSTLKNQDKIPDEVNIPAIKFVNVGLHEDYKHNKKRPLDLLIKALPNANFNKKNVLVTDEVVDSGGSLRRAMKLFGDNYRSEVQGIANFNLIPGWYYDDDVKGTKDAEIREITYQYLEELPQDIFDLLNDIFKRDLSGANLLGFLKDIYSTHFQEFISKYSRYANVEVLSKTHECFRSNSSSTPNSIVEYFKSFGGFLTLRPSSLNLKQSMRYRQYLTEMVRKASSHIGIK